jgi:hypothetical protein
VSQAQDLRAALLDHGVPLLLCDGWDRRGRSWPKGRPTGVVQHNTATASATGPTGAPSLSWCLNTSGTYPYCNLLTARGTAAAEGRAGIGGSRTAALTYGLTLLSAWHSGNGGPWHHAAATKDAGHLTLLGVEHDAKQVYPGQAGALTDPQIEAGARIGAAIADLWGGDTRRIVTHTCWCDGCHLGADGGPVSAPLPTRGRKDDTVGDGWAKRNDPAHPYNAPWWRAQAAAMLSGAPPAPETPAPETPEDTAVIVYNGSTPYLLDAGRLVRLDTASANNARSVGVKAWSATAASWATLVKAYGEPVT